jgi:predicted TPR repeat methyltransferase
VPLRSLAARLDGVDLSERMLTHARARALYDTLECAELVAWLGARAASYDVAVAADVLNYLGALEPAFAAVHAALRAPGCFIFTVEAGEAGMTRDYELRPARRYVHARAYLERIAPRCGFELHTLRAETLRRESQADVPGWLVVLRRA